MTVSEYINLNWDKTVRYSGNRDTETTLLFLPYPYTIPSMGVTFQESYYWDMYFTNRGLILSGRLDLVRNNLRNFIYFINTYGFIPNGSRTYYLNRSQPPVFGLMIRDDYEATGDKAFLREAYDALVKEHDFWNRAYDSLRCAPNGLNRYAAHPDDKREFPSFVSLYYERTRVRLKGDTRACGLSAMAEAESGWDFTARFHHRCHEHNPVDLNSLLWFDEKFLGDCEQILGLGDGASWYEKADARKKKMLELMRGDDGVFYDYHYTVEKRNNIVSCAAFFPAMVGLVEDDAGMDVLLSKLELPYGLQVIEPLGKGRYQWGPGNGWAPLQLVAVEALRRVGREADASRIARKYVDLVDKTFNETGAIWEKYNIITGNQHAVGEYGTPEMMGWTAGVYLVMEDMLSQKEQGRNKGNSLMK